MKLNKSSITKSVNKWGRENFCMARPHLNKTSAGRSMLEMLGVLAIIGMLSVGAVMGFRQAMNRHKANLVLNDVSLAFEELATHENIGAISRYQVTAFTPESGHALYAKRDADNNDSIEIQGVAKGVCEVLIQYDKNELYAQINDTTGAQLTACNDNQTMVFSLAAGSSTDPDPGPGPEPSDPCDGVTCSGHGTCSDGNCTCSDGYSDPDCSTAPESNSAIACVDPKTCSADYHCECPEVGTPNECQTTETKNGCTVIVNVTGKCGTNGICGASGGCLECTSQREPNADGSACVCKAKANCKTQNDSDCTCSVCEDGYRTTSDGQCEEIPACGSDEQSCSSGSNNWCCPKAVLMDSVACGTNAGDCCIGSDCCSLPKTWLAANAGEVDLCCQVGDAAGRNPNEISSWQCCDVSSSEVLVNSTGTSIATNYCCPKGSIAYDALNSKCSSTCPENASTTVVEGNQIGYSSCYRNAGFTWDEKTGKCTAAATSCTDGFQSCSNGTDTWCCLAEKNTCGTAKNECCSDDKCCTDGCIYYPDDIGSDIYKWTCDDISNLSTCHSEAPTDRICAIDYSSWEEANSQCFSGF